MSPPSADPLFGCRVRRNGRSRHPVRGVQQQPTRSAAQALFTVDRAALSLRRTTDPVPRIVRW